jgi:tetratricopeptide (TPR) repeat protein
MKHARKTVFVLVLAAAALAAARAPAAPPEGKDDKQAKAEAKERFQKGLAFVDEGDCDKAIVEFKEAYKTYPVNVILYNMALCYDDMHQYALAMDYYKQYMEKEKKISEEQLAAIKERFKTLKSFLGALTITCNVDGADVFIDGEAVGKTPLEDVTIETGDHKVSVKVDGYKDYLETVTVVSGKTASMNVKLKEAAPSSLAGAGAIKPDEGGGKAAGAHGKKKLAPGAFWGTFAAMLALGAGTAVVGGLSVANHDEFQDTKKDTPGDTKKLSDLKDKGDTYNAVFLTFAALTGAAAVAAIVVGVMTDFKKEKKEKPAVAFVPSDGGGFLLVSTPLGGNAW